MSGVIAAAFPDLHDPRVGIVARLHERRRERSAPEWFHALAETCNPAPLGGVAGPFAAGAAGASRDAALAAAVTGAVARYAAALYVRDGLPVARAADAPFDFVPPRDLALFAESQYRRPGFPYVPFAADTPVRWASAIDLASGRTVHVPASLVWYPFAHPRLAGDLPVAPPWTGGLAAGGGVAAATLAGVLDVVAADAAALFWLSMTPPPGIALQTLPPVPRSLAARFAGPGTRLALLDATTDNRIPAVIAALASEHPAAPAFVFAAAADLDPAAAVAMALARLAEARRRAVAALRDQPPPSPGNDWEDVIAADDHLAFAADRDNAGLPAFLLAGEEARHLADGESGATGTVTGDLDQVIVRIALTGAPVLAANLTPADLAGLGLAVCRAIVPGYLPLHAGHALRPLGARRLFEVPQKLGYRGLARGSGGNPAPHPFG